MPLQPSFPIMKQTKINIAVAFSTSSDVNKRVYIRYVS